MTKCTNCMRGDCCGGDFDELKAELDTFRDASLLLTGKLEDAQAELAALREAAQEAKDLLWKMQNVQPYSDEIHYVGALLNTALLQERWG